MTERPDVRRRLPRGGGLGRDSAAAPARKPDALASLAAERVIDLDVRPALARGEEPIATIMQTIRALTADQVLRLHAPFEPLPLYDVLARRGLSHWTERADEEDWVIWFYRDETGTTRESSAAPVASVEPRTIVLDVRGLEAPEPMVRVLAELDTLAVGQRLEILHDRRPLFLYPHIEERGFAHETDEPSPGLVRIVVTPRRP
jgi:uncharacterized protein (DUF2249 family)